MNCPPRNQLRSLHRKNTPNFRVYEPEELVDISSVRIDYKEELRDVYPLNTYKEAIESMPVTEVSKKVLHAHTNDLPCYAQYKIKESTIFIIKKSTTEYRWFLQLKEGLLLEDHFSRIWDTSFKDVFDKVIYPKNDSVYKDFRAHEINEIPILWLPEIENFTHYLIDSIAPCYYACSRNMKSGSYSILTTRYNHWREEALDWCKDSMSLVNISLDKDEIVQIIKPREVIVPVVTNRSYRVTMLRKLLKERYHIKNTTLGNRVLFSTREDARSQRVENSLEIKKLVEEFGGSSLDFSRLNFIEKVNQLSDAKICIAESSGTMNPALLAPDDCIIIFLHPDMDKYQGMDLLLAGWAYTVGYENRCQHVVGKSEEMESGDCTDDVLRWTTTYPIEEIKRVIQEILQSS